MASYHALLVLRHNAVSLTRTVRARRCLFGDQYFA